MMRALWKTLRTDPLWNLPNLLTAIRMALIPVLVVFLEWETREAVDTLEPSPGKAAALIIFICGMTDLADGILARRWKLESLIGKFLDPVADKLLLMASLVLLLKLQRIEAWFVIVLLSREMLISGLRTVAIGEGIVIPAGQSGKWKNTLQLIGIGCLMWYGNFFPLPINTIGLVILYVALLISVVSGVAYLKDFFQAMARRKPV